MSQQAMMERAALAQMDKEKLIDIIMQQRCAVSDLTPDSLRKRIWDWADYGDFSELNEFADAWLDDIARIVRYQLMLDKKQARIKALEKEVAAWKLAANNDDWSGLSALAAGEETVNLSKHYSPVDVMDYMPTDEGDK